MLGKRMASGQGVSAVRCKMLLAGASAIALANGSLTPVSARAATLASLTKSTTASGASSSAASGLASAGGLTQQVQAANAATQQTLADLVKTASAISAQAATQAAARLAAAASEPNDTGNALGKLLVPVATANLDTTLSKVTTTAAGTTVTDTGSGLVWYGANTPVQTDQYTVTINQTAPKAILTWTQFDVPQNTTVVFNQKLNGVSQRDWIALNRIVGDASPTVILGKIQADGQVFIINQNGVIFGGTSQINVNTLVATSLDINDPTNLNTVSSLAARNNIFLSANTSFYGQLGLSATQGFNSAGEPSYNAGDVTVDAGAVIETPALTTADPYLGRVLLAAPNVTNAGEILVPDGQAVLLGAVQVRAFANSTSVVQSVIGNNGYESEAPDPNLRGVQIYPSVVDVTGTYTSTGQKQTEIVTDTGLIQAKRGNITIDANDIEIDGVLEATTSVKANGSIYLNPTDLGTQSDSGPFSPGVLNLSGNAVVAILPDTDLNPDGSVPTIPESSVTSSGYLASVIQISLPNAYYQSAGSNAAQVATGAVTLESGSLIEAPAATIDFTTSYPANSVSSAPASVQPNLVIQGGAAIDVAGLPNIQHSVSDNIINVSRVGLNELANSPLQRNGPIYRADVNIDVRLGTPLFDASGYISDYTLTASDLDANGGTVAIGVGYNPQTGGLVKVTGGYNPAGSSLIPAVTAFEQGAVINVMGGFTTYNAGYLNTTKLLTADGSAIVDISDASPNVTYAGIAGTYSLAHTRWGVTTTYNDLLLINPLGTYDPGYVQGGNAGSLSINGFAELNGTVDAGAVQGTYQRAGSGVYASAPPTRGTIDLSGLQINYLSIQEGASTATPLNADGSASFSTLLTQTVGTDLIAGSDAGTVTLAALNTVSIDPATEINLQPGTSLTLESSAITIGDKAAITDPSGSITLSLNQFTTTLTGPVQSLTIGRQVTLNVAGMFVNDTNRVPATLTGSDYVNGGTIAIVSTQADSEAISLDQISVGADSVFDVDGGGYVNTTGHLVYGSNGLPAGKGGNFSIILHQLDQPIISAVVSNNVTIPVIGGVEQISDDVSFDPTVSLSAYGLAGGGTFRLQGPEIVISTAGDTTVPTTVGASGIFDVSTAFLQNAGFGSYNLVAEITATIPAGTQVQLQQEQYLPTASASTATTLSGAVIKGMNTGTLRPATNFSLSSLGWIDGQTAHIDPTNQTDPKSGHQYGIDAGFGGAIASNSLTVGQGAAINADPGATITLSATGSLDFDGDITAHGGSITLSQINDEAAYITGQTTAYVYYFGAMLLGANAVLDASGVLVSNPSEQNYRAGTVLPGGTVTLSGTEITGITGSLINVSGASGTLDLPASTDLTVTPLQAATVASAGGTIAFTGPPADTTTQDAGLIYGQIDTSYEASGGSNGAGGTAAGGTFELTADFLSLLKKYASPRVAPTESTIDQEALKALNSETVFGPGISTADINAGDFDVVNLSVQQEVDSRGADTISINNQANLTANRLIEISGFNAKYGPSSGSATFTAPYIEWIGDDQLANVGTLKQSSGGLILQAADTLSLGGTIAFNQIGSLTLIAPQITFVPYSPSTAVLVNSGPQVTNYSGSLITAGAVVLDAGTVYPSTGTSFTIETAGAVTFQNSAGVAAIAPISVGGSLSVEASSITVGTATPAGASQGPQPTIVAPYGQINLGALSSPTAGDPYFATTSTLTVESGAVVTVSGAGQILPYGETQDLQTWLFGQLGALSAAPAKAINIDAATATIASGAKIDLSGGGDIYAYEFITGLGGTNDVLSAAPTSGFSASSPSKGVVTFSGSAVANAPVTFSIALPNGTSTTLTTTNGDTPSTLAGRVAALIAAEGLKATVSGGTVSITGTLSATLTGYSGTVYAIDPNLKANSAPVDIYGYADTKNLNDPAVNAIGKTLTLTQPAAGLAAGTYLLLPVAYANLPGAVRVEVSSATAGVSGTVMQTALDGTVSVAGTLGYAGSAGTANGSRDSEQVVVGLQTAPVWAQYSQINITTGNAFFGALAAANGTYIPPLPADAGQLSVEVRSGLTLNGTLDFSIAANTNGRGGQLFIGAPSIAVVSPDQTASDSSGALVLTPEEISSFDAPRVTLGALGQTSSAGETLNVVATSILVQTDATDPLVNPELTLVATGGITVASGSVIDAKGTLSAAAAGVIDIGAASGASGDGALLRVSNAGAATIVRANVSNATGSISFGDNVVLGGDSAIAGAASIEIDGTSAVTVPATTSITGGAIDISGQQTTFSTGVVTTGGVQLSKLGSLAEATSLVIAASQQIAFDTPLDLSHPTDGTGLQDLTLDTPVLVFTSATGGNISITSTTVTLTDSFTSSGTPAVVAGTPVATSGTLTVDATQTLNLTGGSRAIYGFNHTVLTAGTELLTGAGSATGTLLLQGSDLSVTAPLITAAGSSYQTIEATGAITLAAPITGAAVASSANVGGRVAFNGQSIALSTDISAAAGEIDLTAQGAAGITVAGTGSLNAAGFTEQFLTGASGTDVILPGGKIQLVANTGNVTLSQGSVVDVSGAADTANQLYGNAGSISIVIGANDTLALGSTLRGASGGGATASGGSFSLDSQGAVDFTTLEPQLIAGGFTNSVSVESGVGNLEVSQSLTARQVLLSADDAGGTGGGFVIVDAAATIDANGNGANGEGGTVQLYGTSGVTLAAGSGISAIATDPTQRGGQVTIGVGIDVNGKSGLLNLAAGSSIDVSSGGRSYGSDGSMILFRTPFVNADGVTAWTGGAGASAIANGTVLESTLAGVGLSASGAPNVTLEPYQRIDVAKLYTPDANGVSTINDWSPIFTAFAPQTAALAKTYSGAQVMPGLELDDSTGSITITADLDLAATTTQIVKGANGKPYAALTPTYRYGATATAATVTVSGGDPSYDQSSVAESVYLATTPGILTVRAAGDIDLQATISDGFTYNTTAGVVGGSDLNASADLEQQGTFTASATRNDTVVRGKKTVTLTEKDTTIYSVNPLLESWSYQFVAGARYTNGIEGGNPISVAQVGTFETGSLASKGNFVMGTPPSFLSTDPSLGSVLLRTGTGSIDIYAGGTGLGASGVSNVINALNQLNPLAAGYDAAAGLHVDADASVLLLNPGDSIYTAGYNADPTMADGFSGVLIKYQLGRADLNYRHGGNSDSYEGADPALTGANWNDPAFATQGGDVVISAPNGSVVAQQNFHDVLVAPDGSIDSTGATIAKDHVLFTAATSVAGKLAAVTSDLGQTYNWWLNGQINNQSTGVLAPALWVETGMFRDGVGALGGGDISVSAGGDVRDIATSIVSTYFVNETTTPATLVNNGFGYGGGNLTIAAGNDISSIVTEVEQGSTTVTAGGSIASNYANPVQATSGLIVSSAPNSLVGSSFTWSAGSVAVFARGAIDQIAAPWEGDSGSGGDTLQKPGGIKGLTIETNNQAERFALSYATTSTDSLTIVSEGGDLNFETFNVGASVSPYGNDAYYTVTAPTVTLASVSGSVTVAGGLVISPSATGNLDLLAKDNVTYWTRPSATDGAIQFVDSNPGLVESPTSLTSVSAVNPTVLPIGTIGTVGYGYNLDDTSPYSTTGQTNYTLNDPSILHLGDTQPMRIIALDGSIATGIDPTGTVNTSSEIRSSYNSLDYSPEPIYVPKTSLIYAGLDIVNMSFAGENNSAGDTTLIEAGRDITYTNYSILLSNNTTISSPAGSNFIISGPGTFDLIAGRNLNLEPSVSEDSPPLAGTLTNPYPNTALSGQYTGTSGVQAVGDGINPWLPQESAQLNILFGVSPGIDYKVFIADYLSPTTAGASAATYDPLLVSYVQGVQGQSTAPTVAAALATFDALPTQTQLPLLQEILFDEIRIVSEPTLPNGQTNSQYQDFARAYAAVNALFPASYGYSDDLTPKHTLVSTGSLNMTNAAITTRYTSNINLLGPGGGATVGGLSALGVVGNTIPPNEQGILAVRSGDINAVIDTNFNVFSSRVLALDGGEVTIASINGSIDAGRGKKTVTLVPPLSVLYTPALSAYTDPAGQITGSGIGTLVTIPGETAAPVYLLAPNGDIDAGDAGIRASGNLFIVALAVLNADNIQVGGKAVGIPTAPTVSVNVLSVANQVSAASAVNNNLGNRNAPTAQQVPSIVTVEVLGFGDLDAQTACANPSDPTCQPGKGQ